MEKFCEYKFSFDWEIKICNFQYSQNCFLVIIYIKYCMFFIQNDIIVL